MNFYSYLKLSLSICFFLIGYIRLAKILKFYDVPNKRSSHEVKTVTGAGIIFPLSVFLWYYFNYSYHYFLFGLMILTICSILDDLFDLKVHIRIFIQSLAGVILLMNFNHTDYYFFLILICIILIVGWFNSFNFMDGINGITGSYSLISLFTFYYLNLENHYINQDFIIFSIIPIIFFMFYNFREKAIVFSGNSGTMAMAYILSFVMMKLIIYDSNWTYLIFFSVYGVDTILTIVERLILRENIFKPHRRHLYQLLTDKLLYNHLRVSLLYALSQLLINIIFIKFYEIGNNFVNISLFLIILIFLMVIYIYIKIKYFMSASQINYNNLKS